jgi:hypothetical protein
MKNVEELIKVELSALKSIHSVLPRIKNSKEKEQLTSIWQDHLDVVNKLKKFASKEFKDEEAKSGPWGAFASAFTKGASLFGDKTAMKALKFGEEHGLNEYRDAVKNLHLDPQLKDLIQKEILPVQEKHVQIIENYLH